MEYSHYDSDTAMASLINKLNELGENSSLSIVDYLNDNETKIVIASKKPSNLQKQLKEEVEKAKAIKADPDMEDAIHCAEDTIPFSKGSIIELSISSFVI